MSKWTTSKINHEKLYLEKFKFQSSKYSSYTVCKQVSMHIHNYDICSEVYIHHEFTRKFKVTQ